MSWSRPRIGNMRHRISVYMAKFKPNDSNLTDLEQYKVFSAWAQVTDNGDKSESGSYTIQFSLARADVNVVIRDPSDVKITREHIICLHAKNGDQWYSIVGIRNINMRDLYLGIGCAIWQDDDVRLDPASQNIAPNFVDAYP